jgi:uncharacterized protein (TIGR03083 family)
MLRRGGAGQASATVTRMPFDYPAIVERETTAMVAAVESAPPTTRVPGCPDWDLAELAIHIGVIQRWATDIVINGEPPKERAAPPDHADAVEFLRGGTAPLVAALRAADPDVECWNFTRQHLTKAFWPRRQAIEVAAHRWDAQDAAHRAGGPAPEPIDAALASDSIDEWVHRLVPRMIGLHKVDLTGFRGDVHLHCTDVDGEWTFEAVDGVFTVNNGHRKAAAAVRAPASDLYLFLLHRVDTSRVEQFGDESLISQWLTTLRF